MKRDFSYLNISKASQESINKARQLIMKITDKHVRASVVGNMFLAMFADGKRTPEEMNWLTAACMEFGSTQEETLALFKKMMTPGEHTVITVVPKDVHERAKQLMPVVIMTIIDGNFDSREMEFLCRYAGILGFEPDKTGELVEFVSESIDQGLDKNTVYAGLEKFLKK